MTLLERAPFLAVLASLVTVMALGEGQGPVVLSALALCVCLGLLLCFYRHGIRGQRAVFGLVLFLVLISSVRIAGVLSRPPAIPMRLRTEGVVTEVRPWGRTYVAVLDAPKGRFLLRLPFATVTGGATLVVEGVTRPLRRSSGRGFDEAQFWRGYGVTAWLSVARLEPASRQSWNLHRLRYAVSRLLTLHTPRLTAAYLRAAWTGHRDPSLNEAHRAWGTSHLLAVSGFHVGIVVFCASWLLRG